MRNENLVSVCMITYNHEKYIRQAIESVLMQKTDFTIELIIGEDCSTDHTRNIAKEYAKNYPEIIYAQFPRENRGMVNNFFTVLQSAKGKYIAMCEGDDYWTDPYKLQKQVDFLEANPEYGMVSSDINLIDENGETMPDNNMVLRQRASYKPTVDFFDLLKTNQINTLTVCARADLMKELAVRVQKENLWFIYDYWFWLNISLKSKIRVFDEKMANYRVHSAGISRQKNFFKVKKHLIHKYILFEALKQKRLNKQQFFKKYISLLYRILRSRNTEALAYVIKLKK